MSFAEPLALLFAGLYGVLVLFYLWERWRRRVEVPSLLLWEALREDTIRARRFRPDLLFVLQLLLLTALIAGLARPYVSTDNAGPGSVRHIFVVDTSASMQALEARSSRFEQARAQAIDLLGRLGTEDEVMLIASAPSPHIVADFTRDHAAIASTLGDLSPVDTGGDVGLAVMFADNARQRSDLPTELDLFTDIPRRQLAEPVRDHARVFQVGETDQNVGIEALQIFQGRFQDYHHARAYVLVENFAHRESHGFLTVRLGDQVVNRSGFTLAPRQSKGFLVQRFPAPGRVMAQLEITDALAADNIAYGWIRPVRAVHVLVVSAPSPLLDELRELGAATPALRIAVTDPDAFRPEQAQQADVVILNRVAPDMALPANALYIYPPAQNHAFPVSADVENIEVLDWNARHPVLEALRPLAALPLQRARIVAAPDWSEVLLWSRTAEREFPLAFAGEDGGHRIACITFDVDSEHLLGSDNVNLFLFFMNLLGWLAPNEADVRVVNTGDVTTLNDLPDVPLRVQDPRGTAEMLAAGQSTLQPRFAGEYQISNDGTRRALLANFFDPVESDIGRSVRELPAPPAAAATTSAHPAAGARREYGAWLYCTAAALFLLEWAAARRRTR